MRPSAGRTSLEMGAGVEERPRVLHILPVLGVAGAEQMAASLMIPLARAYGVGAVGLYRSSGSVTERALQREGIPFWNLNKRVGPDPRMFTGLYRILREFRPDVVHTHLHVLRYSLPAILSRHVPVSVHTVHNVAERESDMAGRLLQRLAFRRRWVVPVAVSHNVATSLQRVYGIADATTIPNGIPVADFRTACNGRERWRKEQGFSPDAILFAATGRLAEQKNPRMLVRAFAAIEDSRAHLLLIGDGPLRESVERDVRARGLAARVHVLGYREDVRDCLGAADVFVLSSKWEGHPLGVMEAMASGLPVIATTVGGVPELVEPGRQGILVPPGDEVALTQGMRLLLDRSDLRAGFGHACRERALREFNLENMVRAYDDLYTELLAKRTRHARSQTVTM